MRRAIFSSLLLLAAHPVFATVVISQSSTTPLSLTLANGVAFYAGWTQPSTYTGVTIAASLEAPGGAGSLNAFLVNAQPPTTSQVGGTATIPVTNTSFAPVTLFSGLTLAPGSYYLVLGNGNATIQVPFALGAGLTTTTAPGVTAIATEATDSVTSSVIDAPGWFLNKGTLLFSVTGAFGSSTQGAPALTPAATIALAIVLAVCGLILVRRQKTA